MSLTKVSYSMIKGAPFNVLDYASLAEVVTARDPSDPASHLLTSFLCWDKPIQAAFDACYSAGGGTVVLPKNTVPYYVRDAMFIKANTTVIFEDWLILADYNLTGHVVETVGDNIVLFNLQLDNSNIYAGGSGYNGLAPAPNGGKNIKVYGGMIKNCRSGYNDSGAGDGGKGIQIEASSGEDIVIDGMTFSNCFMAMSNFRDGSYPNPYYGILYNNITADNCKILFFVRQANMAQSQTGLQHTVQLNNFYAVDCGAFEGVFQFSRASNVSISNGIVVNDPAVVPSSPLIRGNHANCSFDNINWYGTAHSCVNVDPSTYAVDSSQSNHSNVYNINVWGQVDMFADANISTSYRTLDGCSGNVTFRLAPATAFFGYELRNGTSMFNMSCNTGPAGNSVFVTVATNVGFNGSAFPYTFAGYAIGFNVPVINDSIYTSFTATAATNVPNSSLFLNTATGKLSYKDSGGTVNALY